MKRAALAWSLSIALSGCKLLSKGESTPDAALLVSSATAVGTPAASAPIASANTASLPVPVPAAGAAAIPGVVTDPNARPSHESVDQAAHAQITAKNYKGELDRLEKEDLSQDKK